MALVELLPMALGELLPMALGEPLPVALGEPLPMALGEPLASALGGALGTTLELGDAFGDVLAEVVHRALSFRWAKHQPNCPGWVAGKREG